MTAEEYRITRHETIRKLNMERYGFGPDVMRNIRICPDCGMPSTSAEKHCRACAAGLSGETLFHQYKKRHRFCTRCDTVVAKSAQFCPECGTRIRLIKPLKHFL